MSPQDDWWASLNHGGLLIAPNKVQEAFGAHPGELSSWRTERLRRELTRFDGSSETLSRLLDFVLEDLSGLTALEWQKAHRVESRWAISGFTKEQIKPRRIWIGPNGETLPVFVPDTSAARQYGTRLGVGRSRRLLSRSLEWLRRMQQPVALVTNGRQWRLVHAGQDYDAWCEWDIDLWFEEGQPASQVAAWRRIINRDVLAAAGAGKPGPLVQSILDSRKGQSELSAILGERVRQAVEVLITASYASIETAGEQDHVPDYRDLYIAGTRIVMRCIIALFAEARGLLPVDNRIYQQAYSIDGLRQQLDRRAGVRGSERLAQGRSAWPRLIALFKLIYMGSAHEALPVPQYSGDLFQPGRADSDLPIKRALALLEAPSNQITDKQVHQILRLLTRTKVRVRQGRSNTWVDGPVDFSALSSEYIGILYEGLLDYELKRADARDPVVFLNVGRQPALPLSRLESMDDKAIKQLFEELNKKDSGPGTDDSDEAPVENDELADEEHVEDEADAEGEDESPEETDGPPTDGDSEIDLSVDDIERAQAWLERAVPRLRVLSGNAEENPSAARLNSPKPRERQEDGFAGRSWLRDSFILSAGAAPGRAREHFIPAHNWPARRSGERCNPSRSQLYARKSIRARTLKRLSNGNRGSRKKYWISRYVTLPWAPDPFRLRLCVISPTRWCSRSTTTSELRAGATARLRGSPMVRQRQRSVTN